MVKANQKVAGSRSSQVMPRVPQEAEHQQKSIKESEVLHLGRHGQQCHCQDGARVLLPSTKPSRSGMKAMGLVLNR